MRFASDLERATSERALRPSRTYWLDVVRRGVLHTTRMRTDRTLASPRAE